jgi:N-acetylmuramoyl-L-alanine amidase
VLALFLAGPGTASAAAQITFGSAPDTPRYGATVTFRGVVTSGGSPAGGQHVDLLADTGSGWALLGSTTTAANGTYAFAMPATAPGSYAAQTAGATSAAVVLTIRPRLGARFKGLPYPGSPYYLRGRLRPARAGKLSLRVGTRIRSVKVGPRGGFRARLPTRDPGSFRATLRLAPTAGFERVRRQRDFHIRAPALEFGSSRRAVLALERRLRHLHYAIRYVNKFYGAATYEAVLAFQKVHRMNRTGKVNLAFWRKFGRAHVPRARIDTGSYIDVDKTRQVLFEVRRGKVVRVVHVSTGATGNTPVGRWHVYLKTPGLLASGMYYSMFFVGAFAIHGYHSVPSWPASHGCVRIPMWLAPALFSRWPLGTTVYIHYS